MNTPHRDRPLLGIGFMLIAMSIVPFIDICGKLLSDRFHVYELTFARYFFHILVMLPVMKLAGVPIWRRPSVWPPQIWRGVMLALTTIFFFLGIKDNPIPNVLAISFISPILVTLAAPVFLGERLGPRRLIAAIIGFGGILVILQPSGTDFKPSLLWGLATGITFAAYQILTRGLKADDNPLTTLFITGLVGAVMMIPTLPFIWRTPVHFDEWALLFGIGFFAALGHYFVLLAYRYGEAASVAPFGYFEIISATLISYAVYDFLPEANVWYGMAIIICAGLYIAYRERRLERVVSKASRHSRKI